VSFEYGKDYGCTDGGCVFGHPGGMHTNGGCRCLAYNYIREHESMRRAHKGILALRERVAALEAENERLRVIARMWWMNVKHAATTAEHDMARALGIDKEDT